MKMRMCLIGGIVILLLVIIVPAGKYPFIADMNAVLLMEPTSVVATR